MTDRSATIWKTASSARVFRSRSTMCWAPATPSCPASCAAGWAAKTMQTGGDLGQCLRRLRRLAAALRAGISDLRGIAVLPQERQQASRLAQGRGDQSYPLGDDPPARHSLDDGARLRPPLRSSSDVAAKTGADPARIRDFKVLAVKAAAKRRRRPRRLRHADRRETWPRGDVRIRPPPLLLARPAGRTAGLAAAALRILAGYRLAAYRMARRSLHQVPVLLPPRRSRAALKKEQQQKLRTLFEAARQDRPRTAGRDHRRQATARSTTRRFRAR